MNRVKRRGAEKPQPTPLKTSLLCSSQQAMAYHYKQPNP
jgi:hypothetical protein